MSIKPYCAVVEAAKARLKSICRSATTPPASALTRPVVTTAGPNQATGAITGCKRMST